MNIENLIKSHGEVIRKHALSMPSKECCGLIVSDGGQEVVIECENVFSQPEKGFIVNSEQSAPWIVQNAVLAYYHSHPQSSSQATPADIRYSEEARIPVVIYSIPQDSFSYYVPNGYKIPLTGRRFIFGVFDCRTAVVDYFKQNFGVVLEPMECTKAELKNGMIPRKFEEYCIANDLVKIKAPAMTGDIVCMSIGTSNGWINHVAIFEEGGIIFHQLMEGVSKREVYGGSWKQQTVAVYRHLELMQ